MKTLTFSLEQLPQAAEWLLKQMGQSSVAALYGEMGAGKTTLIKAVCNCLNVTDTVTSPTFSLINEYRRNDGGGKVCHFDFYRLDSINEVLQLGAEEYFYSGDLCFIEWAQIAEALLPAETVRFRLSGEGERRCIELLPPTTPHDKFIFGGQ